MRALSVLGGLCLLLTALPAAADEFPYTAYVHSDDVYVRSGPGRSYYPTDKLQKGEEVEVYRHDPGGWYAIRPPKDSFSWVSARYLKPTTADLAEVVGDDVVARVGSKLSNVRDVVQIRLDPKEVVEILEKHDAGGQTWCKIAPPAGEFRWVSAEYLSREAPPDGVSQPRRRPKSHFSQLQNPDSHAVAAAEEEEAAYFVAEDDEAEPGKFPLAAHEEAPRPIANRIIRKIEQGSLDQEGGEIQQAAHEEGEVVHIAREDSRTRRDGVRSAPQSTAPRRVGRTFAEELKSIDLELSSMVAEEPTVWSFTDLKQRTAALVNEAGTAIERGEVRRIQHQIARLEDIKSRYRQIGTVMDATDRRNSSVAAGTAPAAGPAGVATSNNFDGQGVLRPVVSRRQDAPRYALVDEQGDVLTFLTPAPGVNLQSHLGESVGVFGTRGYIPDLRKPHVMVRSIEPAGTMLR